MKYPNFIKKNETITLLATSCGSNKNPYRYRTMEGIKKFEEYGFNIKKGGVIFRQQNCVSSPHNIRALDFNKAYKSKNNQMLWSTGGGELMIGMLPFVDFEKIKELKPKYFIGFSDNTNLTFTLTTICDIATIYASSISMFCYDKINVDAIDLLSLMKGEKLEFDSYPFYHGINSRVEVYNPNDPPLYNDEVIYETISDKDETIKGRMLGGCLDVLACLVGTRYDNVKNFIEKYKEDGIIWYFDNCDLNSAGFYRAIFQLQEAGWFKYVKGIIIGRMGNDFEIMGYSFKQAIIDSLGYLNVPIIYNADISHKSPSLPIINGAIASISVISHKGHIKFELK